MSALSNLVARCTVKIVSTLSKQQRLQIGLLAGETKSDIEHMEPYGFTSCPHDGAQGLAIFLGGDRSHGVVVVVGDRRFRLTGLEAGEVALHDDQGQKVHLTRSGIVVGGGGSPVTITDTPEIIADAPLLRATGDLLVTGDIIANGDISDHGNKSMAGMRTAHNTHKGHNFPGSTPDVLM